MRRALFVVSILLVALTALSALGAPDPEQSAIELRITDPAAAGNNSALRIVMLLTLIAVAPTIVLMMSSFTRLIIVMHFLRQALGTPSMPPNQVLIGLALFLSFFVMSPTIERVQREAWGPYNEGKLDAIGGIEAAAGPMREFMLRNTREADLALFARLARIERPERAGDLPMRIVLPAFVISELRAGFEIGFLLFLPFLVVDLVVSSVLLSMGMMMLPPTTVSLPFKVLLFVLVDGWSLLAGSLVAGFR
jgi:flagellar biosynthetic protein FliP